MSARGLVARFLFRSSSGSQSVVPGQAALASPGNLLEMQAVGLCPSRMNWTLEGWSPSVCVFISPPADSEYTKNLRTTASACYRLQLGLSVSSAKRNLISMEHRASDFSEFEKDIFVPGF